MENLNLSDFLQQEENATIALQKAIDVCFLKGGGTVSIPGGDYNVSSVRLRSNITLHLLEDAHLLASRNPEDYNNLLDDILEPISSSDKSSAVFCSAFDTQKNTDFMKPFARWNNSIIKAVDAENISIVAEDGTFIDGRDCFDELGEENYRGPHAINMHRCENILFKNVFIKNSANWAYALFDCSGICCENTTVIAGHDGIHLISCDNISIINSDFQTGDDCIAGIDNMNVMVANCKLNTACSAFRFGGCNVTIDNCFFYGPGKYLFRGSLNDEEKRKCITAENKNHRQNMLSAFLYFSDFTRAIRQNSKNILIKNCVFKNVDRFLEYNFSGSNIWQQNKPLENIMFQNIVAEGIKKPLVFYGDKTAKADLTLTDCSIAFSDEAECEFMHICNFDNITLKNVTVKNVNTPCLIKKWSDDGKIIYDNFIAPDFNGEKEINAVEEFKCEWI